MNTDPTTKGNDTVSQHDTLTSKQTLLHLLRVQVAQGEHKAQILFDKARSYTEQGNEFSRAGMKVNQRTGLCKELLTLLQEDTTP